MNQVRIQEAAQAFAEYRLGKINPRLDTEGWVCRVMFLNPSMVPQGVSNRELANGQKRAKALHQEFRMLLENPTAWKADPHPSLTPTQCTLLRQKINECLTTSNVPKARVRVPVILEIETGTPVVADQERLQKEVLQVLNGVAVHAINQYVATGSLPYLARITEATSVTTPFSFTVPVKETRNGLKPSQDELAIRQAVALKFDRRGRTVVPRFIDGVGWRVLIKKFHRNGAPQEFAVQMNDTELVFTQV